MKEKQMKSRYIGPRKTSATYALSEQVRMKLQNISYTYNMSMSAVLETIIQNIDEDMLDELLIEEGDEENENS